MSVKLRSVKNVHRSMQATVTATDGTVRYLAPGQELLDVEVENMEKIVGAVHCEFPKPEIAMMVPNVVNLSEVNKPAGRQRLDEVNPKPEKRTRLVDRKKKKKA